MSNIKIEDVSNHGLMRYQFDSYLKNYKAKVVNCSPFSGIGGKKGQKKDEKYNGVTHVVELSNTILFCEGGGQPSDKGKLNKEVNVIYIGRDENKKVQHYVDKEVNIGEEVEIELDWERREDHMQQHSAQHLISAIAETEYKWETSSWWLGEDKCNIEFDPKDPNKPVTSEILLELEAQVNKVIREARPVSAKVVLSEEVENNLPESERKSSARHHGALRVIEIAGVDSNQCCGTHVSSTSELQVVKFLGKENARGQTRVYFNAGHRVIKLLSTMLDREVTINGLLSAGAESHIQLITKMQNDVKLLSRSKKQLMSEIAEFEILKLKNLLSSSEEVQNHKVLSFYRPDADIAFLSFIATNIAEFDPFTTCLFACGDLKDGMFLISSPKASFNLTAIGNTVAQLLKGKGGGKAPRYQGKATDLSKLKDAELLIINEVLKNKN